MGIQRDATEYLIWLQKHGAHYKSNLMDTDYREVIEHKKFLFFKWQIATISVTEELAKQILNRTQIFNTGKDLEGYYNTYCDNKLTTRRGFYKEIDSEKDYNVSSAKELMFVAKKINSFYEAKKDNKDFDAKVSEFIKVLNKNVVYEEEQSGFDVQTYMTVKKLDENDKKFCKDFQEDMNEILYNSAPKQFSNKKEANTELEA